MSGFPSTSEHTGVDDYMSFITTSPSQPYNMDETYQYTDDPSRHSHRIPSNTASSSSTTTPSPYQHLLVTQQQAQASLQHAQQQLNQRTQVPHYQSQSYQIIQHAHAQLDALQQQQANYMEHKKKHIRHSSVSSTTSTSTSSQHHSPILPAQAQSVLTQQLAQFASSTLQTSPHLQSMTRSGSGSSLLHMGKQPLSPNGFTLSPTLSSISNTGNIPHLSKHTSSTSITGHPTTTTTTTTSMTGLPPPTTTTSSMYTSHRNSAPNLAAMEGTSSHPTTTTSFTPQPTSSVPLAAPPSRPAKSSSRAAPPHHASSTSLPQDVVSLRRIKSSPVSLQSLDAKFGPPSIGITTIPTTTPTLTKARSGSSKDLKTTQQKAQRRLARKAEAARASRRRKKHYVQSLEEKVAKLTLKLNELETATRVPTQSLEQAYQVDIQAHVETQNEIKQRLVTLVHEMKIKGNKPSAPPVTIPSHSNHHTSLSISPGISNSASSQPMSTASTPRSMKSQSSSPSSSSSSSFSPSPPTTSLHAHTSHTLSSSPLSTSYMDEHDEMKSLNDQFVNNSKKRQNQVEYYLTQLEQCLVPGVAIKFAIWGLSQRDDFYTEQGLWHNVMGKEVGLSDQQMEQLMSFRQPVIHCMQSLQQTSTQLQQLHEMIRTHLDRSHQQLDELRSLLTPLQFATFTVWVEQNPLCMEMLSTVWKALRT